MLSTTSSKKPALCLVVSKENRSFNPKCGVNQEFANHSSRYKSIRDSIGLLLANKQTHKEANTTLFSKNMFLIMVEWDRVHPFRRCDNPLCELGAPCYIMFEYFKKTKHLYIIVTNTRALSDPGLKAETDRAHTNLKTVVKCLLKGGSIFKTLKIRYNCFDGQLEAVRDSLEGELPDGMPELKVMIKDKHGKIHLVSRAEALDKLFKYCSILDPLRNLKAVAEDVKIREDLPQAYINKLTKVLSVSDPAPVIKKRLG